MANLNRGYMTAIDPSTGVPNNWSLDPENTLGLVFWTKDPTNIILDGHHLQPFDVKVHVTMTGWHEAERGAPEIDRALTLFTACVGMFGSDNVTWRFSPVPVVYDVLDRFERIARTVAATGVRAAYVSFLQENDRVPETRPAEDRLDLLRRMSTRAMAYGVDILLCNEDRTLAGVACPPNLRSGICADPASFNKLETSQVPPSEGCGCVLMADPFTINESCSMGCTYCYASDENLADKKRNTTSPRRLTLVK